MSSSDATMSSPLFVPQALQFYVNRLSFSKNRVRLQALSTQVASANSQVIVRLPSNTMINLASLTMTGGVRATIDNFGNDDGVALPTNWDFSFIETLSLIANGGIITQPFINYKLLGNTLNDVYGTDDKNTARNALQGSLPSPLRPSQEGYQPFAINNWISATQTMAPSYISTNLLGDLELRLTMTDNAILQSGSLTSGACVQGLQERCRWDMRAINFYIETASIQSNMLEQAIAAKLAGGEPINVPFENVFSFQQTNDSGTYNQRFSVSSQSVNKIVAVSQRAQDARPSVDEPDRITSKNPFDAEAGIDYTVAQVDSDVSTCTTPLQWSQLGATGIASIQVNTLSVGDIVSIEDLGSEAPADWQAIGATTGALGETFEITNDPSSLEDDALVFIQPQVGDAFTAVVNGNTLGINTGNSDGLLTTIQGFTATCGRFYNGIPSIFRRNYCGCRFAQFSVNNQYSPNYQIDSQVNNGLDLVTADLGTSAKNYSASNVLVETRAAMDVLDYDYESADKLTSYTQMPFEFLGGGVYNSGANAIQPSSGQIVVDDDKSNASYWFPYTYKSGISAFLEDKFIIATSFDLDVCDKDRLVSGINTLGSNAQMFLNVVGGANNDDSPNQSTIFVLCTSMVQIYQGATLQIIQ